MATVTTAMKKFLNDPADVVRESLRGLAAAHGDLLRYDADGGYVARVVLDDVQHAGAAVDGLRRGEHLVGHR